MSPGHVWLFKRSPDSTIRARVSQPMRSGTVLTRPERDGPYVVHDPMQGHVAHGILLDMVSDFEGEIVVRRASVIGSLLNQGRGIEWATRCELVEALRLKVIP